MQIFTGVPEEGPVNDGLLTTAIFSVFAGYFFGEMRTASVFR